MRVIDEDKRYVGWGKDMLAGGGLTAGSVEAACKALEELVARALCLGCESPVLVGTNTLREAADPDRIVSILERRVGLPVSILSQREEAELGFLGASCAFSHNRRVLLLDPGGTSTEVSWGSGGSMDGFIGIAWGTHRVDGLIGRGRYLRNRQRLLAGKLVEDQLAPLSGGSAVGRLVSRLSNCGENLTILVTGGTVVSLAVCVRYMRGLGAAFTEMEEISQDDLRFVMARLSRLFEAGSERRLPLGRERTDLLLPGLVLLSALLDSAGISRFRVTARDLRWAVVMRAGPAARFGP